MSGRDLRRRVTAIANSRAHRPSQSPSRRKIRPSGGARLWRPSENVKELKRSKSEPLLQKSGGVGDVTVTVAVEEEEEDEEGVLYRPRTCADIFSSSPENSLLRSSGNLLEGYNKEAKVVINVTVEGSPGPIRTMVKLGSNVDETIKLVLSKYNEEGRTPYLNNHTASTCELHHSCFSLESLRKSDLIGEVGSRSFYLRKCSSSGSSSNSITDKTSTSSNHLQNSITLPFFPGFMYRKMKKIIRRTRKIWKILGCIS